MVYSAPQKQVNTHALKFCTCSINLNEAKSLYLSEGIRLKPQRYKKPIIADVVHNPCKDRLGSAGAPELTGDGQLYAW